MTSTQGDDYFIMLSPESESCEIEGTIRSVVFQNADNGYAVLQIENEADSLFTLRGRLPAAARGEQIRATGRWVNDHRYGRQFEAKRVSALPPSSSEGIAHFLGSGLIDGIGPSYAKRIVDAFGTDTFRIIEEESQRLEEIPGIGKAKRRRIRESWKKLKSMRDLMIALHEYGISTSRALRLYRLYGDEAVNILRTDPYRLARDVPGIGFHTSDTIARQMGQSPESPRRLAAGIRYTLETAEQQGHCALPRSVLVQEAAALLAIPISEIGLVLDQMILSTDVIPFPSEKEILIFHPDLWEAETKVSQILTRLLTESQRVLDLPTFVGCETTESSSSSAHVLSDEQISAVERAAAHRFSILTGGPGTGKTTVIRSLIRILVKNRIQPVLCAPTGRAAHRLSQSTGCEASTIHRVLEYQPTGQFSRNRNRPLVGDFFIVDESSMIDIRLMASLLEAIPSHGSLLLVGDSDQLPSVGPGRILADLIESRAVPVSRLGQIYRQAEGSRIVEVAHQINGGVLPSLDHAADSDFFFLTRKNPEAIIDTLIELITRRIPAHFGFQPRDEIQVLTPMNRNSLGTKSLNERLQAALNPPDPTRGEVERFGTRFRAGDKVIQIRNNYEREIFNGDIGYITEIQTTPPAIHVSFEHHPLVCYEPDELDELQLAYAITIHKAQGSEFPAVLIPLAGQHYPMLQRNLLYTAVTRGRRLVMIVGERRALDRSVTNVLGEKRYSGLQARLAGGGNFPSSRSGIDLNRC